MPVQQRLQENREVDEQTIFCLLPYPVDMSPFLLAPPRGNDTLDTPFHASGGAVIHDPTKLVQYALAHWNQYLISRSEHYRDVFLLEARWLIAHTVRIGEDALGWPVYPAQPELPTQHPALSAVVQGCALSVLVRAYQLTQDNVFMEVAQHALHTFERDILDGGI